MLLASRAQPLGGTDAASADAADNKHNDTLQAVLSQATGRSSAFLTHKEWKELFVAGSPLINGSVKRTQLLTGKEREKENSVHVDIPATIAIENAAAVKSSNGKFSFALTADGELLVSEIVAADAGTTPAQAPTKWSAGCKGGASLLFDAATGTWSLTKTVTKEVPPPPTAATTAQPPAAESSTASQPASQPAATEPQPAPQTEKVQEVVWTTGAVAGAVKAVFRNDGRVALLTEKGEYVWRSPVPA